MALRGAEAQPKSSPMFTAWINFVRRRWRWIVALNVLSLAWWFLSQGVTAQSQVAHRTEALRQALASKNSEQVFSFLSEDYADQWNLSGDQLRLAVRDVNAQFLTLQVQWEDPQLTVDGRTATLTAKPRLEGKTLTAVGEYMLRESRRFQAPFEFHWQKEGIWPWSWKVTRLAQPELQIPSGYRPGMLSEASSGTGLDFSRLLNP